MKQELPRSAMTTSTSWLGAEAAPSWNESAVEDGLVGGTWTDEVDAGEQE